MSQKIRIKLKSYDHSLVDKSAEKIVKTVKASGCRCQWSHTSAYPQTYFYCKPFDFREQEVERTVRTLFIQTISSTSTVQRQKPLMRLMKLELPSGVEVEIKV